jgi:hypothetical protein
MGVSVYHAGEKVFAVLMASLSVFLLVSIPSETQWFNGLAISKQPRFWPTMCIVGLSLFAFAYAVSIWLKARTEKAGLEAEVSELMSWLRPFEFVVYFLIYVVSVPWLGYLLATVSYFLLMTWRMGYRKKLMWWVSVATALTIVLLFKTLLQVKISAGAWYDLLPDSWATFMIVYF